MLVKNSMNWAWREACRTQLMFQLRLTLAYSPDAPPREHDRTSDALEDLLHVSSGEVGTARGRINLIVQQEQLKRELGI